MSEHNKAYTLNKKGVALNVLSNSSENKLTLQLVSSTGKPLVSRKTHTVSLLQEQVQELVAHLTNYKLPDRVHPDILPPADEVEFERGNSIVRIWKTYTQGLTIQLIDTLGLGPNDSNSILSKISLTDKETKEFTAILGIETH